MERVDFDILVTAQEAWPAFKKAVLSAKSEIVARFRIFDMTKSRCFYYGRSRWFYLHQNVRDQLAKKVLPEFFHIKIGKDMRNSFAASVFVLGERAIPERVWR